MKYFVVTDVHDHYSLMRAALLQNGFEEENAAHHLIVCGDAFYSGPEPKQMFDFMRHLHEQNRLHFVCGNHDKELLDNIEKRHFGRKANRTCCELVVGEKGLSDEALAGACDKAAFTEFLKTALPFFETPRYIFVHGFIPTSKKAYNPNWRNEAPCLTADGMLLSMRYHISEPGKTIVFGHFSAARAYKMRTATETDWENKIYKSVSDVAPEGFKPFYGETFIAMDQSVKNSGFVNCIVIED